MKELNLNEVEEAKDFVTLKAGGYVCIITSVTDKADKEYLKFDFDIKEGEFKNYYTDLFESKGFWAGNFIKSYKESALPFFKKFITAVEKCNPGYVWNNDETQLENKLIGLVLGEEEYENNNGDIKTKLIVTDIKPIEDIKKNNYKIQPKKVLKDNKPASFGHEYDGLEPAQIDDDSLPF